MTTPITEAQKAYLAGMLDADGHISIVPHKSGNTTAIRLAITNTYIPLLDTLVQWTGGTIGLRRRPCLENCDKTHVHNRKQSFRFIVVGDSAVIVLQNILPYMIEKRGLAEQAIKEGLASRKRSRVQRESSKVKELREIGWDV